MFVLICPKCGHHEQTLEPKCSVCGEAVSSVIATEIPDRADIPSVRPSSVEAQAEPAGADNTSTSTVISAAYRTGSVSTPDQSPDANTCMCDDKRPVVKDGIVICEACTGIVPTAAAVGDSRAQLSDIAQGDATRMGATLPWGEEVFFSEHLLLGRAAHPDGRFSSLSLPIRARLQKEYGTVSRFHVLLTADETGVTVEDLGAMNGSYVGGSVIKPRSSIRVQAPFEIRLGGSCSISVRHVVTRR